MEVFIILIIECFFGVLSWGWNRIVSLTFFEWLCLVGGMMLLAYLADIASGIARLHNDIEKLCTLIQEGKASSIESGQRITHHLQD